MDPDPHWYSAKKLDQDPDLVNPDPKHWVRGPTHLISAAPGSADTYIPVGTGTYSPRQCSAWICRNLHTCRYWQCFGSGFNQVSGSGSGLISRKCWMDPDSLNPDPSHWVPVPTHVVSGAPRSADTHIPVGTSTYSPRQCSTWIRRYLHTCRYQYLLTSSVQRLDPQIPT